MILQNPFQFCYPWCSAPTRSHPSALTMDVSRDDDDLCKDRPSEQKPLVDRTKITAAPQKTVRRSSRRADDNLPSNQLGLDAAVVFQEAKEGQHFSSWIEALVRENNRLTPPTAALDSATSTSSSSNSSCATSDDGSSGIPKEIFVPVRFKQRTYSRHADYGVENGFLSQTQAVSPGGQDTSEVPQRQQQQRREWVPGHKTNGTDAPRKSSHDCHQNTLLTCYQSLPRAPSAVTSDSSATSSGSPLGRRAPPFARIPNCPYSTLRSGTAVTIGGRALAGNDGGNENDRNRRRGQRGVVMQYDSHAGRYVVRPDNGNETLSLPPSDVLERAQVYIRGDAAGDITLDGLEGTVVSGGFEETETATAGRRRRRYCYVVFVPSLQAKIRLNSGSFVLRGGTVVRLADIQGYPGLNRVPALVRRYIPERDVYDVDLSAVQTVRVDAKNVFLQI